MDFSRYFSGQFMQPQVYQDTYFEVDTTAGTELVPSDVIGRTMSVDVSALLDYLEGEPLDMDEMVEAKEGWLARLSASGYMDSTDWAAFATEGEAWEYLVDTYGEVPTFTYCVNKDERGEFNADVRNADGETVWETYGEVFEDGYMRHKDDMDGLAEYLRELGIMEEGDELTKA